VSTEHDSKLRSLTSVAALEDYPFSYELLPGALTVYWKSDDENTISFALEGKTLGYVALGWSTNGEMIGSDAVIGWVDQSGSHIGAYKLVNQISAPPELPSLPIVATNAIEENGITTVFFTRNYSSGGVPIVGTTSIVIAAIHSRDVLEHHDQRTTEKIEIDFQSASVRSTKIFSLKFVHAILMFLAWGALLIYGVLSARYGRDLPNQMWFLLHRGFQFTGYLLALCGFIIAFVMTKGPHFHTVWHSQLGLTVMICGLVQIGIALVRPPKPDDPKQITPIRRAFEIFHRSFGITTLLLAQLTIFAGLLIIGFPQWVLIAYLCYLGFIFLGVVFAEVRKRIIEIRKESGESSEEFKAWY
jgi:hypothetical protein